MKKILVVEDDQNIADNIQSALLAEKYVVEMTASGADGLLFLKDWHFDLAIVDWGLPELEGVDLVRNYRASGGKIPILLLTGRGALHEKETGFQAGVDDYLTKPFAMQELLMRVRALLRRPIDLNSETSLSAGDLTLDTTTFQVTRGRHEVKLLPREFAILELLARNPNCVFSIDQIFNRLWTSETDVSPEIVRTHIKNLRKKLEVDDCESPIKTVHGVGYRFVPSFESLD